MRHPWLALYVSDFRADTFDLDHQERGVYLDMIMLAWMREDCALPNDREWMKTALRPLHGHTFNRIVPKLLDRYWQLGADDRFRQKRLTAERERADKISAKQSENSRRRWDQHRYINNLVNPMGMPPHLQRKKEGIRWENVVPISAELKAKIEGEK